MYNMSNLGKRKQRNVSFWRMGQHVASEAGRIAGYETARSAANRIGSWYRSRRDSGAGNKTRVYLRSGKRDGSKTGVKTTSGIRTGEVMNEGTGGQCSYFNGKSGKSYLPPHVENALPPQSLQSNGAVQLKSTVGKQAVAAVLTLNSPSLATSYTGDKITRVLYEKASGDITLNNIYLSNCYVIIYDIMARKDVSVSAIAGPDSAWTQGSTDEGLSTYPTLLGATPWGTELFNQFYEVKQVTNVVLGAGATHVHKVRLHPNRIISAAYSQYTQFGIKDLTYWCMVEFHGSPANDTTTQTQVGIGVGGLNIVSDAEVTLKQLQNAKPTISINNTLITAFTVAEQVVNLGGSTIVPQAEG